MNIVRKKSGKPFKSGAKLATIKGIIEHPYRPGGGDAYTFHEDDSCVSVEMVERVKTDILSEIISFKTAKLANYKGFQLFYDTFLYEYHRRAYTKDGEITFMPQRNTPIDNFYEATTQDLLHKWIREKHYLFIYISNNNYEESSKWCFDIHRLPSGVIKLWKRGDNVYNTYEEAMEQALIETLNSIK